jgi:outer membrane protein OmpA-like peptidoglycan-associated protein
VDRTNLGDIATNVREEFTVATKNTSNNQFTSGQPLPNPFNDGSFYNYGTASLSVDNKEMIICACKMEKVYNQNYLNCDLYTTTFKRSGKGGNDFKWAPLVNMGEGINTKDGWEAQPSLSADGKLLFYTTLRKGSRDNDIYFSERMPDGSWSVGKPFDIVNTAGKDKSPFFHQDGETLYFVSESNELRKGVGGLDIFYIRKEKDSWSSPKNIGYPINSSEDELGLFVSTDGKSAYYSSMKEGDWNIYSFDLYKEARPQEVVIIKGELKDENNKAISDAEIEITYEGSDEKTTFKVNGDDGKYAAVVKVNQADVLALTVKKEGFAFTAKLIETEVLKNPESKPTPTNFKLETISPEKAYNINDILFASDSYVITSKAQLILSGFASYLQENESLNITIQGHTDDLGVDNENKILSQQRADAVRSFLISKGVSEERMKAIGYGESKPKYPNISEENRTKNRRTEFMIQN